MTDILEREFDGLATTLAANVQKSVTAAAADVADEIKKVRQICTTQDLKTIAAGNSMKNATVQPAVVHGIIRALSEKAREGSPSAGSIVVRMRLLVRLVYLKMAMLRVAATEATPVSMQQLMDEMLAVLAEGGPLSNKSQAMKHPLPQAAEEDKEDAEDFTDATKILLKEYVDYVCSLDARNSSFESLETAFLNAKSQNLNTLDAERISNLSKLLFLIHSADQYPTFKDAVDGLARSGAFRPQYVEFVKHFAKLQDQSIQGNAEGNAKANASAKAKNNAKAIATAAKLQKIKQDRIQAELWMNIYKSTHSDRLIEFYDGAVFKPSEITDKFITSSINTTGIDPAIVDELKKRLKLRGDALAIIASTQNADHTYQQAADKWREKMKNDTRYSNFGWDKQVLANVVKLQEAQRQDASFDEWLQAVIKRLDEKKQNINVAAEEDEVL